MSEKVFGYHSLFDFHGCDPSALRASAGLRTGLVEAIRSAGGTIVTDTFHHFSPHGVSGVVVIAESHVTIHTWPEHGYAAVDVFSCGSSLDHEKICSRVHILLRATSVEKKSFPRGMHS